MGTMLHELNHLGDRVMPIDSKIVGSCALVVT